MTGGVKHDAIVWGRRNYNEQGCGNARVDQVDVFDWDV